MLLKPRPPRRPFSHIHLPCRASVDPSVTPQEYKDAMASLAFSICVVAARHGDEQLGRTVTSFMPLSSDPPLVLVSIDARSKLIDLIGGSGGFSISFLNCGQAAVSDAFAGRTSMDDRFSNFDWQHWPSGSPKLIDAMTSLDCEVVGSLDAGDHLLFIGAIIEEEIAPLTAPLAWHYRGYTTVRGAPLEAMDVKK